jgi:hypothetical protein
MTKATWFCVLLLACWSGGCWTDTDPEHEHPDLGGGGHAGGAPNMREDAGVPSEGAWTRVDPGGDTICARGDAFHFFVRRGSADKLAIVFDGGGACWDARTCSVADSLFSPVPDDALPEPGEGIADLTDGENPLRDWNAVFIPYCTGDIHWGDNVMTYTTASGAELEIHHKGQANVRAVLDFVYEEFEAPETILVTGISAGAYGAIGWAPYVMEHYPDSFVVQLGDSGAGVVTDTFLAESFPNWGAASLLPDWIDMPANELSFEDLYIRVGAHYPSNLVSQYNTYDDENQRFYYEAMGGTAADWSAQMRAKIANIIEQTPNFRSFMAGGTQHGVLPYPEFYTYAADGVRVRDWVADLVDGREVDNVQCGTCSMPELYAP